ncbi:hypothetical protein QQS21_003061 [Conoideocrella luteorostrata]|uniref:Uncharacterized protein n=1 Tax=Conoideocrella luteorostrata TaxID=1105319 RepID=A0AAJ0G2I2_9HYPO|nr:hypothetical protein QQS21_003061 [Conoideocrella luteorostrata]
METSEVVRRDGDTGGLSLGVLLAIALCGGILLFTTVGLLMAWRIKIRQKKPTARAYTIPDEYSQTRLTKRPLLMTESAVSGFSSRFSSRFSLTLPAIPPLPPMPSYNSFNFFRTPSKKWYDRRSWVSGDDFHGPQVNKEADEGWFARDSWFGQAPSALSLGAAEQANIEYGNGNGSGSGSGNEMAEAHMKPQLSQQPYYEEYRKQQQQQQEQQSYNQPCHGHHHQPQQQQDLHVQKRHDGNTIQNSQSTPSFRSQDDVPRGRQSAVRKPAQAHVRPSITMADMGLRDILRSTDQRLREGSSRSPVKNTPQSSPNRGSPTKTPHSRRSISTRGTGRQNEGTPSPHKVGNMKTSSTQASVTSIGSAANSLLAEATEQLELPGGTASPSRLRGREWEPQGNQVLPPSGPGLESPLRTPSQSPDRNLKRSPQRIVQQRSPQRRGSVDSDHSSSLSTLYSVGEPETEGEEIQRQYNLQKEEHRRKALERNMGAGQEDPFVDRRPAQPYMYPSKEQPAGPRPLRHIKSMSPSHLIAKRNESPISQPLRPISANAQGGTGRGVDFRVEPPRPMILRPPQTLESDAVRPKGEQGMEKMQIIQSTSESSFTSASVHSQDSDATALPSCETPKPEWINGSDRSRSPTASPLTPTKDEGKPVDLSSSPFSEEELLSMLLRDGANKRALPLPPQATVTAPDGSVISTALTPRPSVHGTVGSAQRKVSDSSSFYSIAPEHVNTSGSPTRRGTNRSTKDAPALSMTIAELRRMNSIVSSYSAASIASTVVQERDTDSPTLPAIFGGNVVPPRQVPKAGAIGSRHYLNIGKVSPKKHKSMISLRKTSSSGGSRSKRPRSDGVLKPSSSVKERGKENQGLGIMRGKQEDLPRLREVRQSPIRPLKIATPRAQFASPTGSPSHGGGRLKQGPVADLIAREKKAGCRDSVESLGLYDTDGFLLPSPDREAREMGKRSLRM